jgi:hypothetical protein
MKNNKTDYAQKLQDPRWQRKRLEVMQAAGWKCVICGDKDEELNVHHPAYSAHHEPWEHTNLQCLCKSCHTIQHIPKTKMMIHAKQMVTEHIFVTHEQQFLNGIDGLIMSMAKFGPKHVGLLCAIRRLAVDEYNTFKAKTDFRLQAFFKKFNKDQADA